MSESENIEKSDEIKIIYNINRRKLKIKLFDIHFINNNKDKCYLIIEEKKYDLIEYLLIKDIKTKGKNIEIKLKGFNRISDMSYMFYDCSSIFSLPNISKWNTSNITNMSYMFSNCSFLFSLPDISK